MVYIRSICVCTWLTWHHNIDICFSFSINFILPLPKTRVQQSPCKCVRVCMKESALLCFIFFFFFCLYVTSFNIAGCWRVFVVAVPGPKMSDSVDAAANVAVTATALSVSFVYIRFVQTHKGNAYTNRPQHTHTHTHSHSQQPLTISHSCVYVCVHVQTQPNFSAFAI